MVGGPDLRMFLPVAHDKVGMNRARADMHVLKALSMHGHVVYTDGSYAEEVPQVGFTGYGAWFGPMDLRNFSEPLLGPNQTHNHAELMAYIAVLHALPIAANSHYYRQQERT